MAEDNLSEPRSREGRQSWPNATTLVVAAATPRQFEWAAASAFGLVRELAEHRQKVVLADLQTGQHSLRAALGIAEGPGIVDVLFRGASFSAVARRPESESFYFLAIGTAPPPRQVLFQHPRWPKIASRLPDSDAYLLPCVSADDWLNAGPIAGFAPCIVLNGAGLEVELPTGARRLAEFIAPHDIRDEIEPLRGFEIVSADEPALPEPEPIESDVTLDVAGGEEELPVAELPAPLTERLTAEGSPPEPSMPDLIVAPRPQRRSTVRSSLQRAVGPFAAVAAIAVLAFVFWNAQREGLFVRAELPEDGDLAELTTDAALVAAADGGADTEDATPVEEAPPSTSPPVEPPVSASAAEEITLAYSVVIASYSSFDDAMERQRRWSRAELPFYVAPTVVRGVVYYRVFAGMVAEREGAEEIMQQLVAEGIKEETRAWDVKAARFVFRFGSYGSAGDAHAVVEALLGRRINAYMVPAAAAGTEDSVAYHVYAGGYERAADADPLREQIASAGLESELVERVGLVSR